MRSIKSCGAAVKKATALLAVVMAAIMCLPSVLAEDADSRVDFEQKTDGATITLTAVLSECGCKPNAVLAALEYDPSKLSILPEDVQVLSGGMLLRTTQDESHIAAECAYLEPLGNGSELVSFCFTTLDGVEPDAITSADIRLCGSNEFICSISTTYSGCHGLILMNGSDTFTAADGVDVTFALPDAPDAACDSTVSSAESSDNNGESGCASGMPVGAVTLLAVAAAVLLLVRTGKTK